MPHQCVRCNTFYDDGATEIIKGCRCGGKLFFYIKNEHIEEQKQVTENLTPDEKTQIEQDIIDLVGNRIDYEKPIILDLESINVVSPGKFEIDIVSLFRKDKPLIYKLEEGKYVIDLPRTFQRRSSK